MTEDPKLRMSRVEDAVTELIYQAEQFSNTGRTMHDMKVLRRYLLDSARRYGRAMDNLARAKR